MKVTLVDPGIPELRWLGPHLQREGILQHYVTGFWSPDSYQKGARLIPSFSSLLRRRSLPPGIPESVVRTAGAPEDVIRATCNRIPPFAGAVGDKLARRAMYRRNRRLAEAAASLVESDSIVVAPYGCAVEAFRAAEAHGARRVLDYPIAHHRYSRRLLNEEAELQPEFAGTLRFNQWPRDVEERLDTECELADCILVGSPFVKDTFVSEGISEAKIRVAPYGVNDSAFHPNRRSQDSVFRVLFAGQIGQRKGISYLLDGYRKLQVPRSELHLVGNITGDHHPMRRRRDMYRHTPHIPNWQMPEMFGSASVFVLPSLIEGMALVVLEAMAAGLPVIVTHNTGTTAVVRDGIDGFVIPIRDADAIAEKLDLLYRDASLRQQMGSNARKRAEEFDWNRYQCTATSIILGRADDHLACEPDELRSMRPRKEDGIHEPSAK